MGLSESGEGCMRHQHMKQSPGVCSYCLRERLTELCASNNMKTAMGAYYYYNNNNNNTTCFSSMSLSPSASSSTFDDISPASHRRRRHHHHHHHHRNVSDVMGSISLMLSAGSGLKKSRSIALVAKPQHDDFRGVNEKGSGKKKSGFWSKLLGTKEKRSKGQVFMHSNTVRERIR